MESKGISTLLLARLTSSTLLGRRHYEQHNNSVEESGANVPNSCFLGFLLACFFFCAIVILIIKVTESRNATMPREKKSPASVTATSQGFVARTSCELYIAAISQFLKWQVIRVVAKSGDGTAALGKRQR